MKAIRRRFANWLVWLAGRIDPVNDEVMKFWANRFTDLVILGKTNIKVSVVDEDVMSGEQK